MIGAEAVWAVRHEMAQTLDDVLARRTRSLLLNAAAAMDVAPRVAALMARELGQDRLWEERQIIAFRRMARGYTLSRE